MNIDNQTVLHIKAGHLPPKELLERILATKPNAFGFAVQEADGADMQTVREDASNLDLESLDGFLNDSKDRPATLYFGSLKDGHSNDDIQPFVIQDGDDNTFMSIFMEGTINGQDEPVTQTEQFNLVHGIIIPKIVEWCQDFDGDLDKIMSKINGDVFNKDFLSHVGHRAILHILPFKGDPVLLGPNELGINDAEWGWSSRSHGFGEAVQEPIAEPVADKKKWYSGKKATVVGATTVVDTKAEVTPPPLPQDVATKGDEPRVDTKASDKPVAVFVRPPAWLHKNDDKKLFYCIVGDTKSPPSAWKKNIPVEVKANASVLQCKNIDDWNKWRLENLKSSTAAIASSAPVAVDTKQQQSMTKQERVTAKAEATPAAVPLQGPVDPTPLPIIEPKDLEKVLDYVAKHLDGSSREIIPPHEMQKLEANLPSFGEATATSLEDQLNWPVSGLFGLAATDPRAMVLFALQWRSYARPFLMAELKAKKKDGHATTADKVVTKTTDLGNGGKKQESVVVAAPVVAAAPKKNSWGYGKNKAA